MTEALTAPQRESTSRPVDWLFDQFAAMYGRHWFELWTDTPIADVKDAWQTGLAGVTGLEVKGAMKRLGTFPPTLPEFRALCKPAAVPAAHRPMLPSPRSGPIPAHIQAEIDKFLKRGKRTDPKDWARQILAEAEAGTYRYHYGIECAREALGMKP